jgi:hypothetical protein
VHERVRVELKGLHTVLERLAEELGSRRIPIGVQERGEALRAADLLRHPADVGHPHAAPRVLDRESEQGAERLARRSAQPVRVATAALSIGPWPSFSDSEASSMSLSFTSKGLSFRSAFCSARVVFAVLVFVVIIGSPLTRAAARGTPRLDHDSSMMTTIPQIVSSVLPTA